MFFKEIIGSYTNAQKLIQFQCQKIGLTFRFKMRVFYNPIQFNNNGFFVFSKRQQELDLGQNASLLVCFMQSF